MKFFAQIFNAKTVLHAICRNFEASTWIGPLYFPSPLMAVRSRSSSWTGKPLFNRPTARTRPPMPAPAMMTLGLLLLSSDRLRLFGAASTDSVTAAEQCTVLQADSGDLLTPECCLSWMNDCRERAFFRGLRPGTLLERSSAARPRTGKGCSRVCMLAKQSDHAAQLSCATECSSNILQFATCARICICPQWPRCSCIFTFTPFCCTIPCASLALAKRDMCLPQGR